MGRLLRLRDARGAHRDRPNCAGRAIAALGLARARRTFKTPSLWSFGELCDVLSAGKTCGGRGLAYANHVQGIPVYGEGDVVRGVGKVVHARGVVLASRAPRVLPQNLDEAGELAFLD